MPEWIQASFWGKEVQKRVAEPKPKQGELFSAKQVAQFGVNPRPIIPIPELTSMRLAVQDLRSEEEKNRDDVQENAAGVLFFREDSAEE